MQSAERFSRGQARMLTRLAGFSAALLALAALLLFFAPLQAPPSLRDIAKPSERRQSYDDLLFAKYSELSGGRHTPFEFEQRETVQIKLPQQTPEPETAAQAAPPPKPKPDIQGLTLVGTAPGSNRTYALLKDEQSGDVLALTRGDTLRNAVIKDILADKIVLALADETAELLLPKAEAGRNAGSAPPPVVSAGQQTFINASTASPAARSVITAGAARTDGAQPADGSVNNANDGGADASQAGAASDSSGSSGGSSGGSSSGSRPSLGISGHMLSFEKQQELGLQQTGLLVTAVRRSDIDVQVDDVVLAIDGQTFSSTREALAIIRDVQSGSVQLTVFRSGSQLTVTVNLS